jgi:hypothetical protein
VVFGSYSQGDSATSTIVTIPSTKAKTDLIILEKQANFLLKSADIARPSRRLRSAQRDIEEHHRDQPNHEADRGMRFHFSAMRLRNDLVAD